MGPERFSSHLNCCSDEASIRVPLVARQPPAGAVQDKAECGGCLAPQPGINHYSLRSGTGTGLTERAITLVVTNARQIQFAMRFHWGLWCGVFMLSSRLPENVEEFKDALFK